MLPPYYTKENAQEDEKWRDKIHKIMAVPAEALAKAGGSAWTRTMDR